MATGANLDKKEEGGEGKGDGAPTFTQDDVNRMLAQHKRDLKKENEELRTAFESTKGEVAAVKQAIEAAARDAGMKLSENGLEDEDSGEGRGTDLDGILADLTPPKGVSKELWMQVQSIKHGYGKQIGSLSETIQTQSQQLKELLESTNQEKTLRQQAEAQAREEKRNNLLTDALVRANCRDLTGGIRYLKDQTEFYNGQWRFKPAGWQDAEDYISIDKGVAKELPSYLVKSNIDEGGAGSNGAGSESPSAATLATMEASLAELREKAMSTTRNERLVVQYQKSKREVDAYRKSIQKGAI